MQVELTVITVIIGCVLGVVSFFWGRQSIAKTDGEKWGKLTSDMKHIENDIKYIRGAIDHNADTTQAEILRLHKRVDEILQKEHQMPI